MNNEMQTATGMNEVTRLAGAGGGAVTFAAKVKSNYSYNVYMVKVVEIIGDGISPVGIGNELKAINLAESFTQEGQLQEGKYVLVCSSGDKNLFYAEP